MMETEVADGQKKQIDENILINMLDKLDANIFISDIDSCEILYMNKKMLQEISVKDPAEVVGKLCKDFFHKDFNHPCDSCPGKSLRENFVGDFHWENFSEVTKKFYKNTDTVLKWTDGRIVHMHQSVDYTALKKAELKASGMLAKLELLIANYPGIILFLDENLKFTVAAGTKLNSLGIRKDNIIGKNFYDIYPETQAFRDIFNAAKSREAKNMVLQIGDFNFDCQLIAIFDENRSIAGYFIYNK